MFQPYNDSLPFKYMDMCEYKSVLSMNFNKNIYINFFLIIFYYAYHAKQETRFREFCGSKFRFLIIKLKNLSFNLKNKSI